MPSTWRVPFATTLNGTPFCTSAFALTHRPGLAQLSRPEARAPSGRWAAGRRGSPRSESAPPGCRCLASPNSHVGAMDNPRCLERSFSAMPGLAKVGSFLRDSNMLGGELLASFWLHVFPVGYFVCWFLQKNQVTTNRVQTPAIGKSSP